jgi:hypothetical protein
METLIIVTEIREAVTSQESTVTFAERVKNGDGFMRHTLEGRGERVKSNSAFLVDTCVGVYGEFF